MESSAASRLADTTGRSLERSISQTAPNAAPMYQGNARSGPATASRARRVMMLGGHERLLILCVV